MKTNIQLQKLIDDLKKQSYTENVKIWKRIARDLEKPTQNQRIVNVNKLEKYMNDDEIMIVPGKVLGGGDLNKKLTVAAFKFSDSAKEKLHANKCIMYSIEELMRKNPKGKKVRIIG